MATPTPATGIAVGPENQSMMVCRPLTQYKIMHAKVSSLSKEKKKKKPTKMGKEEEKDEEGYFKAGPL